MKHVLKLTKQERITILTDAIETRSIQYWAYEESGEKIIITRNEQGDITKAVITAPNFTQDGSMVKYIVTPSTIQKGINVILSEGFEIRKDIIDTILTGDNDDESCDCIIQAALFGKLVYG